MRIVYKIIHGRLCAMKGHRAFAVPKATQWVDQIASRTNMRGNWDRIDTQTRGSRLIVNHHR